MYTYLIILCTSPTVATPRYAYIDYKYASDQQNISPLAPVTSNNFGEPTATNVKTTDATPTSTTQTLTQPHLSQETPCASSAITILSIPSNSYVVQLPTTQHITSTSISISTSTSFTGNVLHANSSRSINGQQPTPTPENYKTAANTSESAIENTNQKSSSTSYSAPPVQTTPPNSALLNNNSQSALANTISTVSAKPAPTLTADPITPDSGFYGDGNGDNELDYLQQVHNDNDSIDSSNQTVNGDDDEVILTTNNGIAYGYGYDNTPYE
jgi:hypothetical protein